jgi:predicted permease
LSTAQYVYFTDHSTSIDALGIYRTVGGNVTTSSGPARVRAVTATPSLMSLLGVRAALGRVLQSADAQPGNSTVALVSRGFWTRVLGASPSAVGTTIQYNNSPLQIVGVIDGDVDLPGGSPASRPDIWLPLYVDRAGPFINNHAFTSVAHLAPGASAASAETEIRQFTPRLAVAFPRAYSQSFFDRYGFRSVVIPLKDDVIGTLSRSLWMLGLVPALVLLIAVANVANLFVVRMDARRRDLAIRAALGAGRARIVRLIVAESLALSVLAALVGLIASVWGVPAVIALAPADVPRLEGAGVGLATVGFTAVLAAAVGFALALYPAIVHAGRRMLRYISDVSRSSTTGRERLRVRALLVAVQVGLALTLAVGAVLLLATLSRFRSIDVGFKPRGVAVADLYLSPVRYPKDDDVWRFQRDVLARVRAMPGVVGAGETENLPVDSDFGCTVQGFEEQAVFDRLKAAGLTTCAGQEITSPGYLETMGIPLREGRALTDADNDDPTRAAVVISQSFAKRFWPDEDPIGKAVAPNGRTKGPFYHVVGVVGDVPRAADAGAIPLSQPGIVIYYPMRHDPRAQANDDLWPGALRLVVRTSLADATAIVPSIRRAVAQIDPEVPIGQVTSMDAIVGDATSQVSFVCVLLTLAAATALVLAAVGLYGTISYVVARRTREIGMRLAIGAPPGLVRRAVVLRSLGVAALGIGGGLVLSMLTTRAMRALVPGVGSPGVSVYLTSASLLLLIVVAASWLPARRASQIDPVQALRAE